jgi:hypothetical protein
MIDVVNAGSESIDVESIWLEICVSGASHCFEMKSDEARAVTVGSLVGADVVIDQPGVAPIQFYIERAKNALWIVPAYNSSDLRVNTAPICGPDRIAGCAVIECAGIRVHASLLDADVMMTRGSSPRRVEKGWDEHTGRPPDGSYIATAATRTAVADPFRTASIVAAAEGENTLLSAGSGEDLTQVQPAAGPFMILNNMLARDTIEMSPFWIAKSLPTEDIAPSAAKPFYPASTPQFEEATVIAAFEPLRSSGTLLNTKSDPHTQSTTLLDIPCVQPKVPEALRMTAWLGLFSKRKTLPVWLAATTSILALLASTGLAVKYSRYVARLEHNRPSPSVRSSPEVATHSAASEGSIKPNPTSTSTDSLEHIAVVPAIPSVARNATKRGQANDPELVVAVGHFIAGRIAEANEAYATLAIQRPGTASIAVMARLLAKRIDPQCAGNTPKPKVSCPEVKP